MIAIGTTTDLYHCSATALARDRLRDNVDPLLTAQPIPARTVVMPTDISTMDFVTGYYQVGQLSQCFYQVGYSMQ